MFFSFLAHSPFFGLCASTTMVRCTLTSSRPKKVSSFGLFLFFLNPFSIHNNNSSNNNNNNRRRRRRIRTENFLFCALFPLFLLLSLLLYMIYFSGCCCCWCCCIDCFWCCCCSNVTSQFKVMWIVISVSIFRILFLTDLILGLRLFLILPKLARNIVVQFKSVQKVTKMIR